MSRYSFLQVSISLSILFSPALTAAQQRGAAAPTMQMPMVAPSHAMVAMAPAATVHVSTHTTSVQAIHPGNHSSVPGTHIVSGKSLSHPNSSKVLVHNHPIHSTSGVTTGGATNGKGFSQAAIADDGLAVPGLGFDYAHFAAVHPEANRHRFMGGAVVPFVGGGIYLPMVAIMGTGQRRRSQLRNHRKKLMRPSRLTLPR